MLSIIDRCRAAPFKSSQLESLNPQFSSDGERFSLSSEEKEKHSQRIIVNPPLDWRRRLGQSEIVQVDVLSWGGEETGEGERHTNFS
jgi:hypothetical protein